MGDVGEDVLGGGDSGAVAGALLAIASALVGGADGPFAYDVSRDSARPGCLELEQIAFDVAADAVFVMGEDAEDVIGEGAFGTGAGALFAIAALIEGDAGGLWPVEDFVVTADGPR